jgi:tetratricopeptide (TPR) repeat protein
MHYYYDGFIWKVREKSTQASLGLDQGATESGGVHYPWDVAHLLKWSPLILIVGWLFLSDYVSPSLAQSRKTELNRMYVESLMGQAVLPKEEEEASWLFTQFEQAQATAAAVPNDPNSQVRAAVLLANFGRNDEATAILEKVNRERPDYFNSHASLADICLYRGRIDEAATLFEKALALATEPNDRAVVNLKLGEVYFRQNRPDQARKSLDAAVAANPLLKTVAEKLAKAPPVPSPAP